MLQRSFKSEQFECVLLTLSGVIIDFTDSFSKIYISISPELK